MQGAGSRAIFDKYDPRGTGLISRKSLLAILRDMKRPLSSAHEAVTKCHQPVRFLS